jgi:3-hydroxyisobutyrate dehydrogenase
MSQSLHAGFIGLGAMGHWMARHLADRGFLTTVWNRTDQKATAFARETNLTFATSPAELAEQVDVICLCVSADGDVMQLVQAIQPYLRPGQIVIDFSTVSRETALKACGLIRAAGADFLDAPVTGGVEGARNATLAIMVGGDTDTLERIRPLLEAVSHRIVHMGDVGMGQSAKAVNQVLCAGINQAVTEALAFGEHLGLSMEKLIQVLSGGAAGNWFLEKRGHTMTQGHFEPGFKLHLHHKDLKICQSMADQLGTQLPLTDITETHYRELMTSGYGEEDISALYRLKRPSS